MNDFDATLVADALAHIKALGATLQTYTPRGSAALSRWILINRNSGSHVEGTPSAYSSRIEGWICNDATNGVAAIITGADTITVRPRLGEAEQTYGVSEIVDQDAGLWHLLLYVNG